MSATEILRSKTRGVAVVQADDDIHQTMEKLVAQDARVALVLNTDMSIAGLVRERDIIRLLLDHPCQVPLRKTAEAMNREVISCRHDTPEYDVTSLMVRHNISELPVVADTVPVATISALDVLRYRKAAVGRLLTEVEEEVALSALTLRFSRYLKPTNRV